MPEYAQCSEPGCRFRAGLGSEPALCARHGPGDAPTDPTSPLARVKALCGATRRDGGVCRQPAVKGAGGGRCRLHGGKAPQGLRAARQRVEQAALIEKAHAYREPRPITGTNALKEEVAQTAGHVQWLSDRVSERQDANLLAVYMAERAHYAKIAEKLAGMEQREEQILRTHVDQLADGFAMAQDGILTALGFNPENLRVRRVVAARLQQFLSDQALREGSELPEFTEAIKVESVDLRQPTVEETPPAEDS